MERISRVVGPTATNVHLLADERTREAIAIDTAIPSLAWIADELAARGWTLKLIVSTHGHWDHIGDNAAVAAHTGAQIAVHPADRERLTDPQPLWAPFEIPPSVPAVELAEGGEIRFGDDPPAGPPHARSHRRARSASSRPTTGCCSAATPCSPAAGAGSTCPAARAEAMVESLARLSALEDRPAVLPGHGAATTIGRERPGWSWSATAGGSAGLGRRPRPGQRPSR